MKKKVRVKLNKKYLNSIIPENLLSPTKKYTKKQKAFLEEKFKKLSIKKIIKRSENGIALVALQPQNREAHIVHRHNVTDGLYAPSSFVFDSRAHQRILKSSDIKKKKVYFSLDQFFFQLTKKQTQFKKSTQFTRKLKEYKKLQYIYGGFSKKQYTKCILLAKKAQGNVSENLLKILESRLDRVLVRLCFFRNIYVARQWISHKKIFINNCIVTIPNYILQPADIISIKNENFEMFHYILKNYLKQHLVASHASTWMLSATQAKKNHIKAPYIFFGRTANNCSRIFKKCIKMLLFTIANANSSTASQRHAFHSVRAKNISIPFWPYGTPLRQPTNNKITDSFLTQSIAPALSISSDKNKKKLYIKNFIKMLCFYSKKAGLKASINNVNLSVSKNFLCKIFLQLQSHPLFWNNIFSYLHLQKYMYKKTNEKKNLACMKISAMKLSNIEVSYKIFTAIYLYSPQKCTFPTSINMDYILYL